MINFTVLYKCTLIHVDACKTSNILTGACLLLCYITFSSHDTQCFWREDTNNWCFQGKILPHFCLMLPNSLRSLLFCEGNNLHGPFPFHPEGQNVHNFQKLTEMWLITSLLCFVPVHLRFWPTEVGSLSESCWYKTCVSYVES